MTEALRSETQLKIGIQPTPGAIIDIPLYLNQTSTVNSMEPRASNVTRRSKNAFSGPRARVGAVLLGAAATFSGLGGVGGVSGQDATETPRTQDPRATVKPAETGTPEPGESAKPTLIPSSEPLPSVTPDPITGLLPCPSPTPEPTETPLPDRTIDPGIGRIGGEVLFAQGMNSDGSIVKLTIFAQEEPSIAPSEDPETALLDDPNCEPMLTADELLTSLIDQRGKDAREKITFDEIKNAFDAIYANETFSSELSEILIPYEDRYMTKEYIDNFLKIIRRGYIEIIPDLKKEDKEREIIQGRQNFSAGLAVVLVYAYGKTENRTLKALLAEKADMLVDNGRNADPKSSRSESDSNMDEALISIAETLLNYEHPFR